MRFAMCKAGTLAVLASTAALTFAQSTLPGAVAAELETVNPFTIQIVDGECRLRSQSGNDLIATETTGDEAERGLAGTTDGTAWSAWLLSALPPNTALPSDEDIEAAL